MGTRTRSHGAQDSDMFSFPLSFPLFLFFLRESVQHVEHPVFRIVHRVVGWSGAEVVEWSVLLCWHFTAKGFCFVRGGHFAIRLRCSE